MAIKTKELPPTELLRKLLRYDPKTGWLYWNSRDLSMFVDTRSFNVFHSQFANKKAGYVVVKEDRSYIHLQLLDYGKLLAHRVVWKMHYGSEPPDIIDHKDGDGTNNRIDNLREANIFQNGWNSKKNSRNKSGYKGVSFNSEKNKWRAAIHIQGKTRLLGYYNTPEEAGEAYRKASTELHGEFLRP